MNEVYELLKTQYSTVTREQGGRLIRLARTSTPLAPVEVGNADRQLRALIPLNERARLALLIDVRAAPLRNDPEFEKAIAPAVDAMVDGFRARATLVRTAVGKLQANRTARERQRAVAVFDDEGAAIAFLLDALKAPSHAG